MKIQSMFQKDIDRDINGVVQVSQDDQRSLKQELDEYIITKELRRHFATFFDNYVKAIDYPTGKIGVWLWMNLPQIPAYGFPDSLEAVNLTF